MATASHGTLWATLGWPATLPGLLFWRLAGLRTAVTTFLYGILFRATVLGPTAGTPSKDQV